MTRHSDTSSLQEQAALWWTVLHDDEAVSATDQREFIDWVAHSPERIEAYLETVLLMRALKSGKLRWPPTPAEELIREARICSVKPIRLNDTASSSGSGVMSLHCRGLHWVAVAAGLLCVAVGCLFWPTSHEYATAGGERRTILLEDGSRVSLNSASRIQVELQKRRRVVLLQQGEALFEVAHDATRPFDVNIGNAVIRAIGTEFDIDKRATRTMVTVIEGRVAVVPEAGSSSASSEAAVATQSPAASAPGQPFPAPAGALILTVAEQVAITSRTTGVPERVANLSATTAWTQGKLMFDHRPLGEVVEEINRYTRVPIVVDSLELRQREITGVIELDDPDSFLSFVANVPGVTIRESPEGAHVVTMRASSADLTERR